MKLQSRELDHLLRKSGMIVRQVRFARMFRKSTVQMLKGISFYFTGNILDGWTFQ